MVIHWIYIAWLQSRFSNTNKNIYKCNSFYYKFVIKGILLRCIILVGHERMKNRLAEMGNEKKYRERSAKPQRW